jgi:hypothetical protein
LHSTLSQNSTLHHFTSLFKLTTGIMVALAINAAEISFEKINPGLDVDTAIEKMQRPSFQSIE